MIKHSGQLREPFLILHGGAGPMDPKSERVRLATKKLINIATEVCSEWNSLTAMQLAAKAVAAMEEDEIFNAGYGSALQKDGVIRQTASAMDSENQHLSGVISIQDVLHPSKLAIELQNAEAPVLTSPGAEALAEAMKLEKKDLTTKYRKDQFERRQKNGCDTVGCVALKDGVMVAVTSTGGRGFETPGRVSDSATVAGNYATNFLACCATGIGEHIVDDAVCARLETRVRDGMSLKEAASRQINEGQQRSHHYAFIALDQQGNWSVAGTSPAMIYVVMSSRQDLILSSNM